jgi:16S rRNA (guanine(966)-N(2))-methyltransferase RsmD
MKITGGNIKGTNLYTIKSKNVRPAQASIRSAIFNILAIRVEKSRVLDLFAGTGSFGFEALCRGAEFCVFVDNFLESIKTISKNIKKLGFIDKSLLLRKDAFGIVHSLEKLGYKFDLIFVSPPYDFFTNKMLSRRLENLIEKIIINNLANIDSLFIIEHRANSGLLETPEGCNLFDRRRYGQTEISFYSVVSL